MGRSVSYPCGAAAVAYGHLEVPEDDDAYFVWQDHIDWFRERIKDLYPSAWEQDGWVGREDHVLMGNHHALFGMSEYCGLVSYWMLPRHDAGCAWRTHYHPELSEAWCMRTSDKFTHAFAALRKLGTMSNGEGVYERIA